MDICRPARRRERKKHFSNCLSPQRVEQPSANLTFEGAVGEKRRFDLWWVSFVEIKIKIALKVLNIEVLFCWVCNATAAAMPLSPRLCCRLFRCATLPLRCPAQPNSQQRRCRLKGSSLVVLNHHDPLVIHTCTYGSERPGLFERTITPTDQPGISY